MIFVIKETKNIKANNHKKLVNTNKKRIISGKY